MGIFGDVATNVGAILQFLKQRVDGTIDDIHAVGLGHTAEHAQSLLTYATQMEDGKGVQDKDMRQEKLIAWLFKIPANSPSGFPKALEHLIISSLWNALPHPTTSWAKLAGPQYRQADGSYNNPDVPNVGRAGGRYIRDVTPSIDTMKAQRLLHNGKGLPPPEEVFEQLYRRREFKPHPCGISSNMFYFATLVTHDLFNTDTEDRFVNKTTSYVDMGWLYGWNQGMQDSVRDKDGHRGKLYEDVFADPRLNMQPPGVAAMALLFCRNHNWIAEQLLVNSRDDFRFAVIPDKSDEDALKRFDEHLFQTARNINIGTFVTAVLYDYVRMLLGVNRENTTWTLPIAADLSDVAKDILPSSQDIPKATGNQCSIEFNFIYRWHSAISVQDEAWAVQAFQQLGRKCLEARLGQNQPFRVPDRVQWTQQSHYDRATEDPRTRNYFQFVREKVERDPHTQRYPDAVLAGYLRKGTEYAAAAFGGRAVPDSLKDVEVQGILHGRQLGVGTLNELRRFCNLRPYTTFLEMNSDPAMAHALETLYGDVANVELYPGLVAEEAKPRQTATGLCAGRTITYAILSDAVALVRGDRFLTTELNPYNLTDWGYDEVQRGRDAVFGNVLGDKLLNRHLGEDLMPRDSIYTQFMFSTPEETKANIRRFGIGALFRETRT